MDNYNDLEKELLKYSRERRGEISQLTHRAAIAIGVLQGRVRALEKEMRIKGMEDDGK